MILTEQFLSGILFDVDLRYSKRNCCSQLHFLAVNDGYGENKTVDFISVTAWGKRRKTWQITAQKVAGLVVDGRIKQQTMKIKTATEGKSLYQCSTDNVSQYQTTSRGRLFNGQR